MRLLALLGALAAAALAQQPVKIVVTGQGIPWIPELRQVAPNATFVASKPDTLAADAADADAILGTVNPTVFAAAKKLRWVHFYAAGVEGLLFPEFANSNVTLTNAKIIQGPEIADHAFALLLAMTRGINRAAADRAKEEWAPAATWKAIELRGKTAVVIGVGGIGSQIATRAQGFGMTVIGVDPKDIPFHPAISYVVPPDRIDTVLPKADVVFVSAPHTKQSEGMIGPKQFELMKKGAYFVAVSRGKLYDTPSLVKALDSNRLAGAGLDVTNPEPLPKGHALWKFENVVITPHIATISDQRDARYRELVFDNVARFAKGEPLRNIVDKVKGF